MSRVEHLAEGVTLYNGDMREVLRDLPQVDSFITDPPYGISLKPPRGLTEAIQGDGREEAKGLWQHLVSAVDRLAKPDSAHLFWTGWSETWTKEILAERLLVKSCVVWAKNMFGIGYYTRPQHEFAWYCHKGKPPLPVEAMSDLWQVPKVQAPIHSCEKPEALMRAAVRLCEATGDGVVCDPFMGVGSTGVAAVGMGRKFIGIELDAGHFDVARKRIEQAVRAGRSEDMFARAPQDETRGIGAMTKQDDLISCLREGWQSIEDLQSRFGWQPHTIRGAISMAAKKKGLTIERVRSHGMTSYRIAPIAEAAE